MKKLVAVLALAAALPAAAQQQTARPAEERAKLGLGVSVNPEAEAAGNQPTVEVYAPLQLAPNLRIEPSLGIWTRNEPTPGTDYRNVTLGVGVFLLQRLGPAVDGYVGGRLKLNFARVETNPGVGPNVEQTGTDVYLAAAAGGEWFPASRFSLGLEAQLGYYALSDASIASAGGEASGLVTTGLGFLRIYL